MTFTLEEPEKENIVAFLSGIAAIVVGLCWLMIDSFELSFVNLAGSVVGSSMNGYLTTCFILGGASLILSRYLRFGSLSLLCASALFLIAGIFLMQYFFGPFLAKHIGITQRSFPWLLKVTPGIAVQLLIVGLALIIPLVTPKWKTGGLLTIILGLSVLSLSILYLYGYLFQIDVVYARGKATTFSPMISCGIFFISLGAIAHGWQNNLQTRTSIAELAESTAIIAASGIALIALMSSFVGIFTLHQALRNQMVQKIGNELQSKGKVAESYFNKVRLLANQVAVSPGRDLLQDYLDNEVPASDYENTTSELLKAAMSNAELVRGITRVDLRRQSVVAVGKQLPSKLLQSSGLVRPSAGVTVPFALNSSQYFVFRNPIFSSDNNQFLGVDLFVLPLHGLRQLLTERGSLVEQGKILLATSSRGKIKLQPFLGKKSNSLSRKLRGNYSVLRKAANKTLRHQSGILNSNALKDGSLLVSYVPVKIAGWGLVLALDLSKVETSIDRQIFQVAFVVLMLSLLGTIFFYGMIKVLLRHTIRLESELKGTSESLSKELHARADAERRLDRHAAELQLILDNAVDGILTVTADGKISSINNAGLILFGYRFEELIDRNVSIIFPTIDLGMIKESLVKEQYKVTLPKPGGVVVDMEARRADGTSFPSELSVGEMLLDNQHIFTVIVQDMSEKVKTEKEIRDALHEKEILLKEIHHRVKNNLQIISSIMRLQARRTEDPFVLEILRESQIRIQSIALLHETLYRSEDLSGIDMQAYLQEVVYNLTRSLGLEGQFAVNVHAQGIELELDRALPCGLITSELVTNAFKHAYSGKEGARIVDVILARDKDGLYRITVKDKGKGLPPGMDNTDSRSLGLRLVRTLCQQLKADMNIKGDNGTTFDISFH